MEINMVIKLIIITEEQEDFQSSDESHEEEDKSLDSSLEQFESDLTN